MFCFAFHGLFKGGQTMAIVKKQFSKKEIEKRFFALYPNGEINLDGNMYNWYWTDDTSKRTKSIKSSNLYDLALELSLASHSEVSEMKKEAGYASYR
jgi:23S rRNA-/tRNA-specific pseudouridylate synthase